MSAFSPLNRPRPILLEIFEFSFWQRRRLQFAFAFSYPITRSMEMIGCVCSNHPQMHSEYKYHVLRYSCGCASSESLSNSKVTNIFTALRDVLFNGVIFKGDITIFVLFMWLLSCSNVRKWKRFHFMLYKWCIGWVSYFYWTRRREHFAKLILIFVMQISELIFIRGA